VFRALRSQNTPWLSPFVFFVPFVVHVFIRVIRAIRCSDSPAEAQRRRG
jgi:hypothetical protein